MPGERFDYTSERQRHEGFVGRAALLARLDALLADDGPDRWVVITGGPGMGKSAILSAWLARREAAGAFVPHHFIRRGAYDWDDPARLVGSLVAQLDERLQGAREPDDGARMHPATRLTKALSGVAGPGPGARGERMVLLIDGLDEYDPPVGAPPGDPLAAFLPHALPRGVSLLCSSRPRHPYVSSLAARDSDFVQLDLDGADSAADNNATVRTFWETAADPLGLDTRFVDEAVGRAGGNVQHAVQLRRQVVATPARLRRVENIPRGLGALIEQTWERIAHDHVVVEGLGILCAAREALTLDELGTVAAWTADATRRAFLRGAKEVLVDTQRPDGQHEYRLHHDSIRARHRVVSASNDHTLRVWNVESGRALATLEGHSRMVTACAVTPAGRRVVSASHDTTIKVWDLESGRTLITLEGHAATVRACTVTPDGRSVISASADYTLKVWDLESGLPLTTLEGHAAGVSACVVTRDGRRVVSASYDQTLKVWDLQSGRAIATLDGHRAWVSACAVMPDGRHLVSASYDKTLKVWDLSTYACLLTHRGDAPYVALAACATSVVVAGDSTGAIWFLDWPRSARGSAQHGLSGRGDREQQWRPAQATPSPKPPMNKHTILFLAANPTETARLAIDEEARAIQLELERSGCRDSFELETRWAVQPLDLLRELRKLKPTVVHFSGHGGVSPDAARAAGQPPRRDMAVGADPEVPGPLRGLCFQGADGRAQVVTAQALHDTFGAAGASVRLVVLNACYSEEQAEALRAHVDCVVGVSGAILDDAARSFAIGFYGGLGERESVAAAFRQGCAAISLEGLGEHDRPKLKVRDGGDASKLVLAAAGVPEPRGAPEPLAAATAATRDALLTRLSRLLPSQFEVVLFRARIPREHLPGGGAAQASRAIDLIHYVELQGRLEELARIVRELP